MRFVRIEVDAFQGIERARVEFGPHLNVFHGRNDLGKSTLVRAMRAALLTPSSSSEADRFLPWHRDVSPRVRLVFQQNDGRYWQVDKTFGSGNRAELASSKDGVTFQAEAKAREVDEKLRTMLAWGVPPPGGRGAPKKLSPSFLIRVLLAEQTDVDQLLGSGLEDDADKTGQQQLTAVLAALAEDPTFKTVLEAAIRECDRYFTDKGQKKRGQASEFVRASDEVTKRKKETAEWDQKVQHAEGTEKHLAGLRVLLEEAEEGIKEAEEIVATLEVRQLRRQRRDVLEKAHAEAVAALARIDERKKELEAAEQFVDGLEQRRKKAETIVQETQRVLQVRSDAVTIAEKALSEASDAGSQKIERRRSELSVALAELRSRQADLELRRERIGQALKAQQELNEARKVKTQVESELTFTKRQQAETSERRANAERELEYVGALRAYGQWRVASDAARDAGRATNEAAALHEKAVAAEVQANALEGVRIAGLPDRKELDRLQKLQSEMELAEAKLGGGLSVQVRPLKSIEVTVSKDGKAAANHKEAVTFDAERSAELRIGDLVTVSIQAGAPEQRERARVFRNRWEAEGLPIMQSLGVADLDALTALSREAEEAAGKATRLRADAALARQQAQERETKATELAPRAAQLPERERALTGHDRAALEGIFAKLGATWETQVEALFKTREPALKAQIKAEQDVELKLSSQKMRAEEAGKRVTASERALAEATAQLGVTDPQAATSQLDAELATLAQNRAKAESELKSLDENSTRELANFQRALKEAQSAREEAVTAEKTALTAVQQLSAELNMTAGRRDQLKVEWARLDRPAAEAEVAKRAAAVAEVPAEPAVSEVDLAAARAQRETSARQLADTKDLMSKAQWELESSGGAVARERLQQSIEALEKSEEAEDALETEAESWKLLKETLREVENDEGTHLGRALARPVNTRFAELTKGRYDQLLLGPSLKADAIEIPGQTASADILEGMSVGRKDQLATVLRITVAEQLRSAIVLDDHLAHTDPGGLEWFRATLRRLAANTQVIVVTCRPTDYLAPEELADTQPGGLIRSVSLDAAIQAWPVDARAKAG